MNTIKKLALALLLATPMIVSASGIGLYLPYSVGDAYSVTVSPEDTNRADYDTDFDLQSSTGVGFMYDSNLGKDALFNYRLGLEYTKEEIDTFEGNSCTGNCEFGTRYNFVNTFGFGVLRTKMVRLWVGPRFNIAFDSYSDAADDNFKRIGMEFGIAPAVGVNVNFGRYFALSADADYRFAATLGAADQDDTIYAQDRGFTYKGSAKGTTVRVYAIFKFGEDYQEVITAE